MKNMLAEKLSGWERTADGALALIVVLDQFPRNMFRGEARTYAADPTLRRLIDVVPFGLPDDDLRSPRWAPARRTRRRRRGRRRQHRGRPDRSGVHAGHLPVVLASVTPDARPIFGGSGMLSFLTSSVAVAALVLCRALSRSRVGYYWQAIREDEQAARSLGIDTFRYKMYAVVISAAMTSFAGMFFAFYYNNLFPEQVFHISRSIELILGPIIGGIGTLFGPLIGAFLLTGLSETMQEILTALGLDAPGAKQVFYGLCLLVVVLALPDGVWPWLAGKLGVAGRRA